MTSTDLPPDDGSARQLSRVVRNVRLIALLSTIAGLIVTVFFGYLNSLPQFAPWFIVGGVIIWFAPGIALLAAAKAMQHRRRKAALLAIDICLFQCLCALGGFVAQFFLQPISVVPLFLCAIWCIAEAELVIRLFAILPLIASDAVRHRGFEVQSPLPAIPLTQKQPPDQAREG